MLFLPGEMLKHESPWVGNGCCGQLVKLLSSLASSKLSQPCSPQLLSPVHIHRILACCITLQITATRQMCLPPCHWGWNTG